VKAFFSLLIVTSVLPLFTSCSSLIPPKISVKTEDFYKKNIIGTWNQTITSGGLKIATEKTFLPNGTAKGVLLPSYSSGGSSTYTAPIKFTSKWEITGSVIKIYEMKSDPSDYLDPNEVHHDIIRGMTKDRIDYHSLGTDSTYYRGKIY